MDSTQILTRKAVRLLARREHGKAELTGKLVAKGADPEMAKSVVESLAMTGAVSDERFAASFAEGRKARGYGPQRIERDLRLAGIDEALIDSTIRPGDEQWRQVLKKTIRKKYGDRPADSFSEWAKRANFLRGKGFSSELVHQALGRYAGEE